MDPATIHLWSPLSPEECATRLAAAVDPETWSFRLSSNTALDKPVIGSLKGALVQLRKRTELHRNSFQTHLCAELRPAGTGTAIIGSLGVHPFVRVFMGCWFGFVILIGGIAVLMLASSHVPDSTIKRGDDGWLFMLVPPGMLIMGSCMVALGRALSRGEADYLTDFLVRLLDAEKCPVPEGHPQKGA